MASQFTDAEFAEHVQRYASKPLDWAPFAAQGDLKEEYRRAHVRMVGASITGKHFEPGTVTANNFTLR